MLRATRDCCHFRLPQGFKRNGTRIGANDDPPSLTPERPIRGRCG
jgi:hypothetical protein